MTISIRPLEGSFAGEVSGIDTTRPISGEEVAALEAGMDRHAVLVFRDLAFTDEPHAWKVHDLVTWDNRCTMHRAGRFDRQEVRDVRGTALAGHASTAEQVEPAVRRGEQL